MTNPYLNRTAIRDDQSFVGRTTELKRLFNRIGGPQPQSVSIVGDRRIGKSSLLRAVLARRDKFLSKPAGYVFVYLDMQSRLRWTPEMFFERLAEEMASVGVNIGPITDYDSLERWCRSLQQEGRALVLLIDEFQVLMKEGAAGDQLPVEFFNYLRSLANSYPVSLVVTSHVDLYTLSKDHRLSGSPLFNILHKLHLGPFVESEARELIDTASRTGCVLAADELWIIGRGGYHPLYLQIACSAAFDWRTDNGQQAQLDHEHLDRRFLEEAQPHFEGTWKLFNHNEREIMSAAARNHATPSALAPAVEDLEERGYLRSDGGHLQVFSTCFREFILKHDDAAPITATPASSVSETPIAGTPTAVLPVALATGSPRAKVFISYAREDQEEVKDLYRRLKDIGLSPWMDDEDIVLGDPWARTIDEAIQSADFFLCCLSTYSVDKAGVLRQELSKGLNQWYARSGPDNYLWPVMLEDCEMPKSLGALQRVDYWKEDGWVRLREGIRVAIARRHNLADPTDERSRARAVGEAAAARGLRTLNWVQRRAVGLGSVSLLIGVLLLIGGLSGDALSSLISRVGLERAKDWNFVLRLLEITALVFGALLISVALLRHRRRSVRLALCAGLWLGCGLLARVDVPAPYAFSLAYNRYLVQRSDDWRNRLLTFVDPVTGGVRDGSNSTTVQAWTTAQAIVGVLASVSYDGSRLTEPEQGQIRGAVNFLETVRAPAPDDGWGYFADRSPAITEITAWSALAEVASVRANLWSPAERATVTGRIARDVATLLSRQTAAGGWSPIRDVRDDNTRTYSTIMTLWALSATFREGIRTNDAIASAVRGMDWLLNERHAQLGWVPNPRRRYQTEDFPGLTGQALIVLELLRQQLPDRRSDIRLRDAKSRFVEASLNNLLIRSNARVPDSDVHVALGESSTTLEGSSFLWYPWSRAALSVIANDEDLTQDVRDRAQREASALTLRTEELKEYLDTGLPYQLAEHLICIRIGADGAVR